MNNTEKFKELYFALQSTTEQDESSEDYQQEKRQKKQRIVRNAPCTMPLNQVR